MAIRTSEGKLAELRRSVDSLTLDYQARGYFPSAAVDVFDAEGALYRAAYGEATVESLFDVASLTKLATATQVLLLAETGRFSIDDGILAHLPGITDWPVLRERLAAVRIRDLLTHTSGLIDWYPIYAQQGDLYAVLDRILPQYPPCEGMVYSDLNFMLLGRLVEATVGEPLARCVAMLGIPGLGYRPDEARPIVPSSYGNPIEEEMCARRGIFFSGWRAHRPIRGQANDGNAFYAFGGVAGHAGLFADVAAYEALGRRYLNSLRGLLREAMKEQTSGRGLGFQLGEMYPRGCGHTGFTGTALYLSPELGIGAVAFTNRLFYPDANPNATNDYRRALFQAVADLCS